MAGQTFLDDRQIVNRATLEVIAAQANTQVSVILPDFNAELDVPLRLHASFPTPDTNMHLRASVTTTGDGGQKSMPPLSGQIITWPNSTINFQAGTTTGGTFSPNSGAGTITLPTSTVGYYIRAGFTLLSTGVVEVIFSPQSSTLGGLANPGTLFTISGLALGWIDLQATAATAYKTANSTSNIIENAPGGTPAIHRFEIASPPPPSASANKTYPNVYLSPLGAGDTTTFAGALALLPASGGVILLMDSITVSTAIVIPENVTILGRARNATITIATGGSFTIDGEDCTFQDLTFLMTATSATGLTVSSDDFYMNRCTWASSLATDTNIYVYVMANNTTIEYSTFHQVLFPSTNTGISFAAGYDGNIDDGNIFTT
jgi:hypothetical protein